MRANIRGELDQPRMESNRQHYELERRLASRLRTAAPEERQGLYREVYAELHAGLGELGLLSRLEQNNAAQVALLCDLLRPFVREASVFLEFGSGDAALCQAISQRHPGLKKVIAVDVSTDFDGDPLSSASGIAVMDPEQVQRDVPRASVDVVLSCHFVEHLHPDDLHDHLLEVMRILRPGGRYVVITPNALLGPHDVSCGFDQVATGLHLREYGYGSLSQALRRAGFKALNGIRGSRAPFQLVPLPAMSVAETCARLLPKLLRFPILRALGSDRPLRALEQVKLLATR